MANGERYVYLKTESLAAAGNIQVAVSGDAGSQGKREEGSKRLHGNKNLVPPM